MSKKEAFIPVSLIENLEVNVTLEDGYEYELKLSDLIHGGNLDDVKINRLLFTGKTWDVTDTGLDVDYIVLAPKKEQLK